MKARGLFHEDFLLWEALGLSMALHVLVAHAGFFGFRIPEKRIVEVDITSMGRLGTAGARPKTQPAAPRSSRPPTAPSPEWRKPSTPSKAAPAPPPSESTPEAAPPTTSVSEQGEIGIGDGSATALSRLPQLLNLADLSAMMRRFYPDEERARGNEGTVVLDLHIDSDGHVRSVDIARSGGADFDDAARRVAKLLRFTPAVMGSQRVAVKMRQAIQFKLEQ